MRITKQFIYPLSQLLLLSLQHYPVIRTLFLNFSFHKFLFLVFPSRKPLPLRSSATQSFLSILCFLLDLLLSTIDLIQFLFSLYNYNNSFLLISYPYQCIISAVVLESFMILESFTTPTIFLNYVYFLSNSGSTCQTIYVSKF